MPEHEKRETPAEKPEKRGILPTLKTAAVFIALALSVLAVILASLSFGKGAKTEIVTKYEFGGDVYEGLAEKYRCNAVELKTPSVYGTAFVYSFDGDVMYLFTNYHIVGESALAVSARFYGKNKYGETGTLQVVGYNKAYDIALLKTTEYPKNDYVDIRKDGLIKDVAAAGSGILCLGNNLGNGIQAQNGIVSSPSLVKNPMSTGSAADTIAVIGACAPFNSGDSGAPIFDTNGNLIGMETWRVAERADGGSVWDTCYLTPAPVMSALYDCLVLGGGSGEYAFPFITMTEGDYGSLYVQDIRTRLVFEDFELTVESVDALGTSALKKGDIIKKFGAVEVTPCNYPPVIGELFRYRSGADGDSLTLVIERGGKEMQVGLSELKGAV